MKTPHKCLLIPFSSFTVNFELILHPWMNTCPKFTIMTIEYRWLWTGICPKVLEVFSINFYTWMHVTSQESQTHLKNLAAYVARMSKCVWPFWDITCIKKLSCFWLLSYIKNQLTCRNCVNILEVSHLLQCRYHCNKLGIQMVLHLVWYFCPVSLMPAWNCDTLLLFLTLFVIFHS